MEIYEVNVGAVCFVFVDYQNSIDQTRHVESGRSFILQDQEAMKSLREQIWVINDMIAGVK